MTEQTEVQIEVRKKILAYLASVDGALIENITQPETQPLRRILDSLDMLDFITYIESEFAIKIDDAEVVSDNFETADSIAHFVAEKRATN